MTWIDVNEKLPQGDCVKVEVKFPNDTISTAKYYSSSPPFLYHYGIKPCHWWDLKESKYIHNVTHWREIEKPATAAG